MLMTDEEHRCLCILLALLHYLCQVFKAAAHQRVGTAVGRHLNSVLDESEQFDCQLVDVQDVAEDHLHVLHSHTERRDTAVLERTTVFGESAPPPSNTLHFNRLDVAFSDFSPSLSLSPILPNSGW